MLNKKLNNSLTDCGMMITQVPTSDNDLKLHNQLGEIWSVG